MEFNTKQWEAIGLLEGISEDRKDVVAHALTVAFNWVDKKHNEQNQDKFQHEILPIEVIHRIAKVIDLTDEEILKICEEINPARDGYDFNKFNYVGGNTIDYEAEFIAEFCDEKIEQYKNK
mgnify:CR=1 FL=1